MHKFGRWVIQPLGTNTEFRPEDFQTRSIYHDLSSFPIDKDNCLPGLFFLTTDRRRNLALGVARENK